ncbi:DNA segregation ATPase FtsK/SpoIIIE, S-DNA-T family [Evansella caseinilytica]|uniref:DNA segregation ATPase FtsK/SpoIIIE, S-DNA-T family n=1 Tax=Evansella caseinilytica TaxID=1503961 RepID=A0A1H3RTG2_9BACI|nr:DNA translocase FtsK [Evansella caseinilytica]SDZ28997.1 DNA segregation ATPase FtsK/SpoIIIE, S-DNA-T family [Evansella caseinilytica]
MRKRFVRFLLNINKWFFPDDEERQPRKNTARSHTSRPRLQRDQLGGGRVIHQYPSASGKFTFPVVKDNETLGQQRSRTVKTNNGRKNAEITPGDWHRSAKRESLSMEQKQSESGERKRETRFQGHGFTYHETPSPIYGFRKHPAFSDGEEQEQEANVPLVETEAHRLTWTQEKISVDLVHPAYPEDDPGADDGVAEPLAMETMRSEPAATMELPAREEDRLGDSRENDVLDVHQDVEQTNDDIFSDITVEEQKAESRDDNLAQDNASGQPEKAEPPQSHAQPPSREAASDEHVRHSSPQQKKPEGAGAKPAKAIPYNVLMFAKDRKREQERQRERQKNYFYPGLQLLDIPPKRSGTDDEWVTGQVHRLNETFEYFRIGAKVVHVTKGPSVTRFEVHPEPGVKVSKITNLTDDLKLSLAAKEIRMEAPIPGKNTIGIEVPNNISESVSLREILHHPRFTQAQSPLTVALGMDISGEPIVTDLQKMPHGLVAGATGSGKSVCVNSILISLMFKASPKDVRLLLIDPKMVELAPYNGIPHLATPVITDAKEATEGLKWAVAEMERRYELFAKEGTRDLMRFNEKMQKQDKAAQCLPYLVIVVDELADLMMVSPQDVEEAICRIAQKARACGIHLLVATQRPSVDVITGLIKANIPTRVAFSVASQADSRTILDGSGAERLLGRGDMLFLENGAGKPVRIQGTFVSDDEIDRVLTHVKKNGEPEYLFEKEVLVHQLEAEAEDELFEPACRFVYNQQAASASLLQRQFRIGYNRAARLIDEMEARGIISAANGSKPREVYLTKDEINGKM